MCTAIRNPDHPVYKVELHIQKKHLLKHHLDAVHLGFAILNHLIRGSSRYNPTTDIFLKYIFIQ